MKKNNSLLLSGPYILWMLAFTLIPLGVVMYYALTDVETGKFTLDNMGQLVQYLPAFWRSILYSLIAAMICLVIGYPVAYYMSRCGAVAQKFLYMLVMLPMCMSFLLRTMAWVGLLQDTGIINTLLAKLGFAHEPGEPVLHMIRTPGAVILGMVYNYLPYMILPLYSVICKIDHRLVEAAEDLGCNGVKVFSKVILPLSMPGILTGMTMVFVPAVSTFYISNKMGSTETILIGDIIERMFKQGDNANMGAALGLLLMALVFVCTGIINRFGGDEEGSVIV